MVVIGAVTIAAIGFAGSFAAVRDLAEKKGFGAFAPFFPIGIDAGIVVLLALDLLLTWIRIPFPLLRQTAWLLTAATIAFNGAAAWPDALGVGMHAVIPVLFVVSVEAARHAIGRIADITADKHMEGVRLSRWLLAFPSTFRLWRRMKLWELRSYDEVIRMEQDRLVYEARLQARYGRGWRRKAPVESMMPLKLARYGVPLAETAPQGLAAAGIDAPATTAGSARAGASAEARALRDRPPALTSGAQTGAETGAQTGAQTQQAPRPAQPHQEPWTHQQAAGVEAYEHGFASEAHAPAPAPAPAPPPVPEPAPQRAQGGTQEEMRAGAQTEGRPGTQAEPQPPVPGSGGVPAASAPPSEYAYAAETQPSGPQVTVPVGPGRRRALGNSNAPVNGGPAYLPPQRGQEQELFVEPTLAGGGQAAGRQGEYAQEFIPDPDPPAPALSVDAEPVGVPDGVPREEFYFQAYREFVAAHAGFPNARQLSRTLHERHGVTNADGTLLSEGYLRSYMREFRERYNTEMGLAG